MGSDDRIKGIEEKLATLAESLGSLIKLVGDKSEPKPTPKQKPERESLESLSREKFLGIILDEVKDLLSERFTEVSTSVKDIRSDVDAREIKKDIASMEAKHKDFWEWKSEMSEIAKRSPGLSLSEVYDLAKLKDPKKAGEMAEKYKSDEEKLAEEKAKQPKPDIFGGLTPTSGKTAPNEKMDPDAAAEAAWTKVFGGDSAA